MTKTSRRSILGWAALGGAMAACKPPRGEGPFSRALDKPPVPGEGGYGTFEERWINSSCAQCPAGCGIRVRVVEGRAVRIEGNAANPVNRGGIGPRGLAGLQALYDADRLTGPMRRDGDRLVPVSWSDALATLTDALAKIAPEQLLVWTGGDRGMLAELLARFARGFGTPRFVQGTRAQHLEQATFEALGVRTRPSLPWGDARYVLSLEAGLLEDSCQAVWFTRAAGSLRRARAKIVHAGPVFDLSAFNADEWVRVAPGTAGALALGIARVLAKDTGAFDRYDPDTVASITGAPASTVERLADEMAQESPAFAVVDDRSLAYSNGLATAHAALALDAVLGTPIALESPPPYASWPPIDGPDPDPSLDLANIQVALLHRVNPAWARPQPDGWAARLREVPLVVSFSPFLDETSMQCADLVLPDHTYLERWEDASPAPGTGRAVAGVRRPVVEPLHDTRATGDVVITLAAALPKLAPAFPWASFAAAMEARMGGLYDAQRGSIRARGREELIEQLYRDGFWADDAATATPTKLKYTDSWEPPQWEGDGLALIAYRPAGYAEGSGANQPWLRMLESRPDQRAFTTPATLHPDDAPGVYDGDRVRLTSPHGSIVVPARIDPRTRPGTVAVPFGGGHTGFGRWAGGGANVNQLLGDGAPCSVRVTLEKP